MPLVYEASIRMYNEQTPTTILHHYTLNEKLPLLMGLIDNSLLNSFDDLQKQIIKPD